MGPGAESQKARRVALSILAFSEKDEAYTSLLDNQGTASDISKCSMYF
jgi:hypothetical protein